LLTDITMPEMNGIELADKISKKLPGIKILFMTGYMESEDVQEKIHLQHNAEIINKPLDPDALTQTIRKILDAA